MIGQPEFQMTARFEGDQLSLRVTAVTRYGDRSVSVDEQLSKEAIDAQLAKIRAQRERVPKDVAALKTALDKGKLEGEELTQAQIGLDSLQKTLVSLEAEQNYQEHLKEVLTKASSKLEPIFTGVIKSLRDTLQQKAFTEAARAAVVAGDNKESIYAE
jgi:hypothetical protein